MTKTTLYAPVHVIPGKPALGNYSNNPDMAPGLAWGGGGLLDPRYPYLTGNRTDGGSGIVAPQILGWYGLGRIKTVGGAPSAIATANISAAHTAASGVAQPLVSSTGAGITVLAASTLLLPSLVTVPTGTLAIDGAVGFQKFGYGFQTWLYNPATMFARAVSITGASGAAGGSFTVAGWDLYGYPQTETIVQGGAVTTNGLKAWKYVASVTPAFTDSSHNYSVGTTDIYDLGLAATRFSDVTMFYGTPTALLLQLVATFTAADATSPATATTGSPRGTFTAGSSSDGTKLVELFVTPTVSRAATVPQSTGLTGVTPA